MELQRLAGGWGGVRGRWGGVFLSSDQGRRQHPTQGQRERLLQFTGRTPILDHRGAPCFFSKRSCIESVTCSPRGAVLAYFPVPGGRGFASQDASTPRGAGAGLRGWDGCWHAPTAERDGPTGRLQVPVEHRVAPHDPLSSLPNAIWRCQ